MLQLGIPLLLLAGILLGPSAAASQLGPGSRILRIASPEPPVLESSEALVHGGDDLSGELGTIIDGPLFENTKVWWYVVYDSGVDTWTDAAALVDAYFPPPDSSGGWRSLVPRNTTPSATQIAAVRDKAGLDWNKLKLASDYSNTLSAGSTVLVIRNGWIAGDWGNTTAINVASIHQVTNWACDGQAFRSK